MQTDRESLSNPFYAEDVVNSLQQQITSSKKEVINELLKYISDNEWDLSCFQIERKLENMLIEFNATPPRHNQ